MVDAVRTLNLSIASPESVNITSIIARCNRQLRIFPDIEGTEQDELVLEVQELALERSYLLCRLLWYISLQAPGEQAGIFALESCHWAETLLLDGTPLSRGAEMLWSNLNSLMDYLSPLLYFPKENPVIGRHVFDSLRTLGWMFCVLSSDKVKTLKEV